jgi:hypothetical protein
VKKEGTYVRIISLPYFLIFSLEMMAKRGITIPNKTRIVAIVP